MFKSANKTEYIDVVKTLPLYNQEELFAKYTGYWPELNKTYYSLFRSDKRPGCRFKWHSGLLYFVENTGYNGKVFFNIADVISIKENISLNKAMLKIVTNHLIAGNTWEKHNAIELEKKKPEIRFKYKAWDNQNYFDIKPEHLYHENVFNVSDYWIKTDNNWKMNHLHDPSKTLTIAYYFPITNHVKLYFPEQERFRWYSNCGNEDIYGEHRLDEYFARNSDLIIITKSQKDRLILDYIYGYNTVAPQNEGVEFEQILPAIRKFKKSFILFDNDATGHAVAEKYSKKYNIDWVNFNISKDVYEAHITYGYQKTSETLTKILK